MKQVILRKLATATSTIAFAALLTVGGSVENAQARRLYVTPYPYNPYVADQSGQSWYAVRAYYAGGPWCGIGGTTGYGYGAAGGFWGNSWTCYSGWDAYKQRNGIGCDPGTLSKGGDGIMYVCQ